MPLTDQRLTAQRRMVREDFNDELWKNCGGQQQRQVCVKATRAFRGRRGVGHDSRPTAK
ncbi:hypothetical protein [Thiospirillum jenense]|uniref:Uncharacterized protein n=1 Tax=Thiospirillum jenense TaxID=1653858 RepID=A0A839HLP0_9GAMM|nr:hypothetical protein [Thiospirillum jenense]MBB1126552.1 hypothetical protein [Thiospirillum jenense]